MNFLEVKAVSKQLQGNLVVSDVSFNQAENWKLALAGETGSGKSTLLKMVAGLVQPDAGQIFFEGNRVLGPEEQLLPGHPGIAYLSQHFELRNNYRVEELLDYANQWSDEDARAVYEVCRIEHLLKRRTDQLSGGEKQRIATARLLISSPKLLLLDEPFTNLDMVHKNILKEVINDIGKRLNITCLLISHDPADILSWADEIMVMKDGQIVQQDNPQNIYKLPKDEYTAGLFGKFNVLTLQLLHIFINQAPYGLPQLPPFLRPEDLQLDFDPNRGTAATVLQVSYLGNSYDVDVLVHDTILTIKTNRNGLVNGQTVYVSLKLQ